MSVSFRDPSGHLEDNGQRIWRHVHSAAREETRALLDSALYAELCAAGLLIGAKSVTEDDTGALRIEHRRVPLPSYPFEWTPAMLADAARLTLEIQTRAWARGWTLKDAAAQNVLFEDGRPIFCDLLSLCRRQAQEQPGWQAYGQFVRHFVLPLLAVVELGRTPRDIFLAQRDGLRAAEVTPFLPWHAQFGLSMWLHVRLPARLERRRIGHATREAAAPRPNRAADGTPWLLGNLRAFVDRLAAQSRSTSTWSEYTGNRDHYADQELQAKRQAVAALVAQERFQHVLDVGANSGEFSILAAQAGCQVVALDDDINALNDLHLTSRQQNLLIQCLHANLAHPTPATGWRLAETLDLERRFAGRFDLVLMLAVVHHLAVTERLPLTQLFETLASYCKGMLLLEFVPRTDPRFIEIAGPNLPLYEHWDLPHLLRCAAPWFALQESTPISEHRTLLHLRRLEPVSVA